MKTIDYIKIVGFTCVVILRTEQWPYFGNVFNDIPYNYGKDLSITVSHQFQTNRDDNQEKNFESLIVVDNNYQAVTGSMFYTHCH